MMKKHSRVVTIAALVLFLAAAPTWAADFRVTNSQGNILTVGCSGATTPSGLVSNGVTSDFTCTGDLRLNATAVIEATVYTVSHDCTTGEIKATTVTQGSSIGTLSLAHSCVK